MRTPGGRVAYPLAKTWRQLSMVISACGVPFFAYGFALEYPLIVESMTPFWLCPFLLPGKQRPPRAREGSQDRRIDVGQNEKETLRIFSTGTAVDPRHIRLCVAILRSEKPQKKKKKERERERENHSLCPPARILSTVMSYYDATRDGI